MALPSLAQAKLAPAVRLLVKPYGKPKAKAKPLLVAYLTEGPKAPPCGKALWAYGPLGLRPYTEGRRPFC